MKLSTAIFRGSKETAPTQGEYVVLPWEESEPMQACALGAGYIAAGYLSNYLMPDEINPFIDSDLMRRWPILLTDPHQPCPECNNAEESSFIHNTLEGLIIHLNDDHGWRRERIAAWLRTLGY
jgi:hypothetical protein